MNKRIFKITTENFFINTSQRRHQSGFLTRCMTWLVWFYLTCKTTEWKSANDLVHYTWGHSHHWLTHTLTEFTLEAIKACAGTERGNNWGAVQQESASPNTEREVHHTAAMTFGRRSRRPSDLADISTAELQELNKSLFKGNGVKNARTSRQISKGLGLRYVRWFKTTMRVLSMLIRGGRVDM